MRFGVAHRVFINLLAGLGILSLIATETLPLYVSAALVVGLVIAIALPEQARANDWVKRASTAIPLVLLIVEVAKITSGAPVLAAVVELSGALTIARLATRRGAQHDYQIALLALLNFIAAAVLGGGLAYALCFVALLSVVPISLVLSHLRREVEGNYQQGARDRSGLPVDVPRILRSKRVVSRRFLVLTGALGLPIFLATALLFVTFPRVGLSWLLLNQNRGERMIGFSDRVDLGGLGTLQTDSTLAMRVIPGDLPEDPPTNLALYLRGTAFDTYDGRAWSRSVEGRTQVEDHYGTFVLRRPARRSDDEKYVIDLEPLDPPVIFIPQNTVAVKLKTPENARRAKLDLDLFESSEDGLRASRTVSRVLHYEAYVPRDGKRSPVQRLSAKAKERYLALPEALPERVIDLAETWTKDASSPEEAAQAIRDQLRKNYAYSLDSPSGAAADPLDHFLFESQAGHCEYYSTAMAVMLRGLGIPTRNVAGFAGGTYNRFGGYYGVRQGDAHSWIEAYFDDKGWIRFDPTPPGAIAPIGEFGGLFGFLRDIVEATGRGWEEHVVGYDLRRQTGMLRDARRALLRVKTSRSSDALREHGGTIAIGLGATVVLVVAFVLLKRRRRGGPEEPGGSRSARARQERAIGLYRKLERAMMAQGIGRSTGTPPLRHAEGLIRQHHTLGREVALLTKIYIETRFGSRTLSDEERREFSRRVRALTARRPDAPPNPRQSQGA